MSLNSCLVFCFQEPILHEPPRRFMVNLPNSDLIISDFLYPGEAPDESLKAVEEMFGFTPTPEELDDEQEIVASPKQVVSVYKL